MAAKTTINKILIGDDVGQLLDSMIKDGFTPKTFILIAYDGRVLKVATTGAHSRAEIIGIFELAHQAIGEEIT